MKEGLLQGRLNFRVVLFVLFQSLWNNFKGYVFLFLFLGVGVGFFLTAAPRILQHTLDLLIAGEVVGKELLLLSGAFGACLLLGNVCRFLSQEISFYFATQVEDRWRYRGLQNYYNLPFIWHDKHSSGEIGSKIDRGGSAIFTILYELLGNNLLVSLVTLVFVLSYSFFLFPRIAFLLFLPLPFYMLATWVLSRRIATKQTHLNKLGHLANKVFYDGVGNVRAVKAFGKEIDETKNYSKRWSAYHKFEYEIERLWFTQDFVQTVIEATMRTAVLGYSVLAVIYNQLTIGQAILVMSYQQLTFAPLAQLNQMFTRLRRNTKRVSDLLGIIYEKDTLRDKSDAVHLGNLSEGLLIENVSFKYHKKIAALHNISLRIPAGTTTALVGRSGAGKSTLALLVMRLYDPDHGRVLFDKVDLRDASRSSLRRQFAFISQDTSLFNRSIRENIAYGRPQASINDVVACAKLAHAHEFIMKTPNKYESVIGERGVKLSGGQRQRIAIARSLLIKPSVLVMDESTSHLDSETEKAIGESIRKLHHKTTQIIIAHRLSTILHADQIVLMNQGRILAVGKHKQLLKCPLYQNLYRLQFHKDE